MSYNFSFLGIFYYAWEYGYNGRVNIKGCQVMNNKIHDIRSIVVRYIATYIKD